MEFWIGGSWHCRVVYDSHESESVKIAAKNLKEDLRKVFGDEIDKSGEQVSEIRISTLQPGDAFPPEACEADGTPKKEAYWLRVLDGKLLITGSDRRGTIYGIYEFSELIGVSPWYFFADVPVKKKDTLVLPEDFEKYDYPSVEYRGIFINDEEELEAWTKGYMGEDTIGVKTYEKVFELLLRLKANYIWPAMHVNSFNVKQENGALAEKMGIVVGTSHCDMLMRSNNREWVPWLEKKGYRDVEYDYSLPGRNREILQEYWRESVEQNRDFEVCYTLGMRGIHDSGFETRALAGLSGEELKEAKIKLLQQIVEEQCGILQDTLGRDTLKTFVPYKEVLPLYDGGLKVPEDITLVWSNDNYGYIRRYPSEAEKQRKGGNGVYYHNSYWAPPGMSYVFLCSIPLAHTANEMRKAYAEGIQKLWVINTGAMKPLEQEIEFFVRLAWEIGKENALTDDVDAYVANWIDRNFSGGIGAEVAGLLNDFSQLTNVRKLEMMDQNTFSQTAYGDEAVTRIHEYERLFAAGNALYEKLPEEEKAAFFEMVLMRIHAAYYTNLAFYYGDRSTLANRQGKLLAAADYVKKTRSFEDARRRMLVYYNQKMLGGKWNGMLNPEGFPPPRAAMMPVCTPPLVLPVGEPELVLNLWNDADRLTFVRPGVKWLEVGNASGGSLSFEIKAPEWVEMSKITGVTETEERILVTVKAADAAKRGQILVEDKNTGKEISVPVEICPAKSMTQPGGEKASSSCEEDGVLVVCADMAEEIPAGFKLIKRLGRGGGNLVEVCKPDGCGQESEALNFKAEFTSDGAFLLEVHRFPSLDSVGRIRIGISVDGGEIQVLESESRDEHIGNWRDNVRNNIDRLYLNLPHMEAGVHTISFHAMDKYFAFSGFAVYTRERRANNLVGAAFVGEQSLPQPFDAEEFAERFYGKIDLLPRPVEYAQLDVETENTLPATDLIKQALIYAKTVSAGWYLEQGKTLFAEAEGAIKIDAASALANTKFAFTEGSTWGYCNSESYGRSGLCMYIPADAEETSCEPENPSLSYRVDCSGGTYTLWLLSKFDKREESFFGVAVDGKVLPKEQLYRKGSLWRYESEQIYRWVPLTKCELSEGEHTISLYSEGNELRFDRVYLTKGEELPPMDADWN